jgi:hypothetical protein
LGRDRGGHDSPQFYQVSFQQREMVYAGVMNTRANLPLHNPTAPPTSISAWVKWTFTAFMAVMVPVYLATYGPTNFFYICDASLLLTLVAVWRNNRLAASMAAVGIVIPQIFWCIDFSCELLGFPLTHLTNYMFDAKTPFFLRALSLYHGWLPFLLIYLVSRVGYDRRALWMWTALAWTLCLIAFFLLPPAGAPLTSPNMPRNVDYVFGMNDAQPQQFMAPGLYLIAWMLGLVVVAIIPTHFALKRLFSNRPAQ